MPKNEALDGDQSLALAQMYDGRTLEIPNALPVRLQTLDLVRHTAIAPDEKRYVVATYDDTHMKRDFVTSVYPQQNGYLTLIRLVICEFSSDTPEQALQRHVTVVQAIQRGKLEEIARTAQVKAGRVVNTR